MNTENSTLITLDQFDNALKLSEIKASVQKKKPSKISLNFAYNIPKHPLAAIKGTFQELSEKELVKALKNTYYGLSLMHLAVLNKDPEVLQYVSDVYNQYKIGPPEKIKAEFTTRHLNKYTFSAGETPLNTAFKTAKLESARILIERGFNEFSEVCEFKAIYHAFLSTDLLSFMASCAVVNKLPPDLGAPYIALALKGHTIKEYLGLTGIDNSNELIQQLENKWDQYSNPYQTNHQLSASIGKTIKEFYPDFSSNNDRSIPLTYLLSYRPFYKDQFFTDYLFPFLIEKIKNSYGSDNFFVSIGIDYKTHEVASLNYILTDAPHVLTVNKTYTHLMGLLNGSERHNNNNLSMLKTANNYTERFKVVKEQQALKLSLSTTHEKVQNVAQNKTLKI